MKVRFDAEACTGHGRCYALAPTIFAADDRGHCVVLAAEVAADLQDQARVAAANCPEGALSVED